MLIKFSLVRPVMEREWQSSYGEEQYNVTVHWMATVEEHGLCTADFVCLLTS